MARAGVAQFSGSRDRDENIAAARRLALKAAEEGVNLLCLHELANTIYPPFTEDRALFSLAEPESGHSVTQAGAIARQAGVLLVYPFFERDGEHFYNSAIIFGPKGEKLAKYRKTSIPSSRLHYSGSERFYFRPGDLDFPVIDTPFGVRVGLIICYERNLPEPARCVALKGADLLFIPVTTTAKASSRWELLLRARAVENVLYVAAANRVGQDKGGGDAPYFGESLIVSPRGEVMAHAGDAKEDLVWADLDLELLRRQRKDWMFFDDRRPELYGILGKAPR